MVVLFTVGLSVPLVEVLGSQREVTVSTGKVLNMPHLSQGCDHLENPFKFKTTNLDIPILNHLSINSKSNSFINKSKLLKWYMFEILIKVLIYTFLFWITTTKPFYKSKLIDCLIDIYFKQDIINNLNHFINKIYDIKLNNHIKGLI